MQDAVRLMEVAESGKILVKHLSGQKPQAFVSQPEQLGAHGFISVPHALEQLLELDGPVVAHPIVPAKKARSLLRWQRKAPTECTATDEVRLGLARQRNG